MPYVDFTLEDVAKQTEQITGRIIKRELEQALIKEREYTRDMMAREFISFWDSILGPALDELHTRVTIVETEVKRIGRLVDQHSKDIMDLRAHAA